MKKIAFAAAAAAMVLCASSAFAEDGESAEKKEKPKTETVFSSLSGRYVSGYGSFLWQGSRIGDSYVSLAGFRGALIVDEIAVGFSGYGLAHPTKRGSLSGERYDGAEPYIDLGYGGLLLEYHFWPKKLVNFSAGVTVGGGHYSFTDRKNGDDDDGHRVRGRSFFYVEPEVAAHLNVTRFCRIGAGVSYRYFGRAANEEFSSRDFRNVGLNFMAAFGWF